MPKFTLQFEGLVLKEYLFSDGLTIGRLPDNVVVVENPAVSGHHARVVRDGEALVLEDLQSTNGTFVNERRITRHRLQNGDLVLIGKHVLAFEKAAGEESAASVPVRALKNLGDTVYLDTKKHRELLTTLGEAKLTAARATGAHSTAKPASTAAVPTRLGILRVVAGRADLAEYKLQAHTSIIGSSDQALVRLRGWFKPKVAIAIARNGDGYVATLIGGRTLVNNERLTGRRDLKDGDLLQVSGLTLEFRVTDNAAARADASNGQPRGNRLVPPTERVVAGREMTR